MGEGWNPNLPPVSTPVHGDRWTHDSRKHKGILIAGEGEVTQSDAPPHGVTRNCDSNFLHWLFKQHENR